MKYIIRDNEVGFVWKQGIFQEMITAGTYHYSGLLGYEVAVQEMQGEVELFGIPYPVLARNQDFLAATVHQEIPDGAVGFLYINGKLSGYAKKKEYIFWNVFETYEIKVLEIQDSKMEAEISKPMLSLLPANLYTEVKVGEGEVGLLYYDNVLQGELAQGRYYFWNYEHVVTAVVVDMKQQELEIAGQEILTKDKIGIRMNISCLYRIRNAIEASKVTSHLKGQLYTTVQLVIREIVGNYKLDEILEKKEAISEEIFVALKQQGSLFCVEFLQAGIKDIILPGEIREIMNSVLLAEKQAQANVIARREEVASTRSLLNTAKLMDENQTLYKLKELEYLEKICEKVGEISLGANAGVLEQLGKMLVN